MGQQVSRSLARALPVLFWTSWLHWRGCQSSQPFPPQSIQQNRSHCRRGFTSLSTWCEQIQFTVPLRCAGCIFHHHCSTFTLVICVSQLDADAAGRSTLKVCSLPLVSPLIRRIHLFYPYNVKRSHRFLFFSFFLPRPCPTDWYSLQCHFHLGMIFVYLLPTLWRSSPVHF